MSRDSFDPVTGKFIDQDVEFHIWREGSNHPAPPSDGTVNVAGRAEKYILDQPGRRFEPGAAAAEDRGHPKSRG